MRMFIKDEVVLQGAQKNYALIVPTKALINEVRSSVINDLNDNLEKRNYPPSFPNNPSGFSASVTC